MKMIFVCVNVRYFQYDGSFTTPGCYEGVAWTVIAEKCEVPQSFLDFLATYESMNINYRAIQPLNGRQISGLSNLRAFLL